MARTEGEASCIVWMMSPGRVGEEGILIRDGVCWLHSMSVLWYLQLTWFPRVPVGFGEGNSLGLEENPIDGSGMKQGHEVQVGSNR